MKADPIPIHLSISEYLATSYRPDRDYVDGELLERNVGARDHSRLQKKAYRADAVGVHEVFGTVLEAVGATVRIDLLSLWNS